MTSNGDFRCNECSWQFPYKGALDSHARQTLHSPYVCYCGAPFSRLYDLDRHIQTFDRKTLYPCPHCSKFSGPNAFARRDHLTQHLRGFHNIESPGSTSPSSPPGKGRGRALSCPHEGCAYHHDASFSNFLIPKKSFSAKKYFTKHLREVHDESLFPCQVKIIWSRYVHPHFLPQYPRTRISMSKFPYYPRKNKRNFCISNSSENNTTADFSMCNRPRDAAGRGARGSLENEIFSSIKRIITRMRSLFCSYEFRRNLVPKDMVGKRYHDDCVCNLNFIRVNFGLLEFSLYPFIFVPMVILLFMASLESISYRSIRIVAFYLAKLFLQSAPNKL